MKTSGITYAAALFAMSALSTQAATVAGYGTNDFSNAGNDPFTTDMTSAASGTNTWNTGGGGTIVQAHTGTASSTPVIKSVNLWTDMRNASFSLQTTVTIDYALLSSGTNFNTGSSFGFALFGNALPLSNGTMTTELLADVQLNDGRLRLLDRQAIMPTYTNTPAPAVPLTDGSTYTLKLDVIAGTTTDTYNLTLSLYDGAGTSSLLRQLVAPTLYTAPANTAGDYYGGIFSRPTTGGAGGVQTFTYDYFSVTPTAVPEPGTVVMLGSGLLVLAILRRRQSRSC